MKRCLALVMALLLLVGLSGCGRKYEGSGYKTPEKAVEAYVKALRSGNSKKLLKTCAIESYVENFDFEAYVERLSVYLPNGELPAGTDMADTVNLGKRLNVVTTMMDRQLKFFMDVEGLTEGTIISPIRDGEKYDPEGLAEALDSKVVLEKLKDAELLDIESERDFADFEKSETYEENLERMASSIGADERDCYVATLEIDGETYILALDVVRYGNRWYVLGAGGALLGLGPTTGGFALESEV